MNRLIVAFVPTVLLACGTVQEFGDSRDLGKDASADPNSSADAGGSPDGGANVPSPDSGNEETATLSWMSPKPTGNDLLGIWGTADDDVWIAGAHGTVVRWDGTTFRLAYQSKSDKPLYAMWGSGKDDMWIGGSSGDGELLHWNGSTWSSSFTVAKRPIHALWGSAANNVWALSEPGLLYHFDGDTWVLTPICNFCEQLVSAPVLRDLWGSSASDVWAVGEEGAIYHNDHQSGSDWVRSTKSVAGLADPFAATNSYRGVWGSSPSDVWAVFVDANPTSGVRKIGFSHWDGLGWRVAQLEDGGIPSENAKTPLAQGHRIWGTSANHVLALVDSYAWHWNGERWSSHVSQTPAHQGDWQAVWGSATRGLVTVGPRGAIGHLEATNTYRDLAPAMRSQLASVSVAPDGSIWAVASRNGYSLKRWTSDGWVDGPELPFSPTSNTVIAALLPLSKDEAWIAGTSRLGDGSSPMQNYGFAAHFVNGAWKPVERLAASIVTSFATFGGESWATTDGAAMHWDGSKWSLVLTPGVTLDRVTMTAANDAWFVGSSEGITLVLHWDGVALREVYRGRRANAYSIWASGPNNVWVGGRPMVHFDGTTWAPVETTDYEAVGIWGTSANDVWMISNSAAEGSIRHWDGTSFTTIVDVSPALYGISGSGDKDVWFVGGEGTTLRYASRPWQGIR